MNTMLEPSKVYAQILADTPDDLGEKIMKVLEFAAEYSPGINVTKQDLIWNIFGKWYEKNMIASTNEDRQIRDTIADLQLAGYPIIAISGKAGYRLAIGDEDEDMAKCIAEIEARIRELEDKARALRHPRKRYHFEKPVTVTQLELLGEVKA